MMCLGNYDRRAGGEKGASASCILDSLRTEPRPAVATGAGSANGHGAGYLRTDKPLKRQKLIISGSAECQRGPAQGRFRPRV